MKNTQWEYYKEIGNKYFRDKNYQDALINYNKAINVNDQIDVLYSNKGTCEKCLKNYNQAILDFKKALNLNPMNPKNLHRLATVFLIVGKLKEALEMQKRSLILSPMEFTYKEQLKIIEEMLEEDKNILNYFQNNEIIKAEERIDFLIKKYPEYLYLKKFKIRILISDFRFEKARELIIIEISNNKQRDLDLVYYLILSFYFEGKYPQAEEVINIMQKENINDERYKDLLYKIKNIEQLKQKANNIFSQNRYEEAIREYTNLLCFDPLNKKFNSIILANRATCYLKLEQYLNALNDLNKSLKLNPKYAKGYVKRCNVLLQLKKYKGAIEDFMKAKELEPSSSNCIEEYLEKINQKVSDLEFELNNEKLKNKKLCNEIISLKNIINRKDFLINDKTDQIDDLRKSIKNLDISKYSNQDKQLELFEKLEIKEERIRNLQYEMNQMRLRYPFELKEGEKLMTVIFVSTDQNIHHALICKNTHKFNILEDMLYDKYPKYSDSENYFIANGKKINKNKTLEFNNIKDSDIITLNEFDFNNESIYNDNQQKEIINDNNNNANISLILNEKIFQ